MLSCKDIAQLASESYDRSLTLGERLSIRLHMVRCRMCSRYISQLKFLRRACSHADAEKLGQQPALSEEAKARIGSRLNRDK